MKFLLVVIALVLGAYVFVGSNTNPEPPQEASVDLMDRALTGMSVLLPDEALQVTELPDEGCSESMLSVDKLNALLNALPEQQKSALYELLSASSNVWQAQLYSGSKGMGLCLPTKGKLVVFPGETFKQFAELVNTSKSSLLPQ